MYRINQSCRYLVFHLIISFSTHQGRTSSHAAVVTTRSVFAWNAGESFEQSPIRRSFKSKVLVHHPESTDRHPFNKDAINMVGCFMICEGSAEPKDILLLVLKHVATLRWRKAIQTHTQKKLYIFIEKTYLQTAVK